MTTIAMIEIKRVQWEAYRELSGSAVAVGPALLDLLDAPDERSADAAYWRLENHVVAQGAVYSSAEPVVRVLTASLVDPAPAHVRAAVLELAFQILSGHAAEPETSGGPDLMSRCRAAAHEGLWLWIAELRTFSEPSRDILELLGQGELAATYQNAWA